MKRFVLNSWQIFFAIFGFSLVSAYKSAAVAQVTSDGTVNTQVEQNGNTAEIRAGERRGNNLFHSFQDFSVDTGNEAFFNNANDISNIFSRVTGGNISNIDGAIRANGSADLFLINPAGIVFGEGARLELGGSFYGSTASSILFEDGEFSAADLENPPLLTVNAPIGLGFRDNPGDIVNLSRANDGRGLEVSPGKNLSLLGGNISFDGGVITAPGGIVELGGLSTEGEIDINEDGSLSFFDGEERGDIFLVNNSRVNVLNEIGGSIKINTSNLELIENSILISGTQEGVQNAETKAGDIEINALNSVFVNNSRIENQVDVNSEINAGNININAINTITLNNSLINSRVNKDGIGDSGGIEIKTNNFSLINGAGLTANTEGQGDSGLIVIEATEEIILDDSFVGSRVEENGRANSNGIEIKTNNLSLINGASINAPTEGQGNAGIVDISAIDAISLNNSFISSRVNENAIGNSGGIKLTTRNFSIINNGNGAGLTATTEGQGDSGLISIEATEGVISDGSFVNSRVDDNGTGNSGGIEIKTNNLSLINGAGLTANTEGQGNAGIIDVTADSIQLDQGEILAETTFEEGGEILLKIKDNLTLRNNSIITAQAFEEAEGGNIDIEANFLIAFPNQLSGNGNDIVASAERGNGGNININAESLLGIRERTLSDSTNDINASSDFSLDGNVTISTPDINPLQGATELPQNIVVPEETSAQACQANRETQAKNGLTVEGKGGVPPAPELALSSQNLTINGENPKDISRIAEPVKTSQGKIQPARGINVTESGKVILTAYRTSNTGDRIPENKRNCGSL